MMKLLHAILLSSSLLGVFSLPVLANPQECLSSHLKHKDMTFYQFEKAVELASINHDGDQWIWYGLSEPSGGHQRVDTVILVNEQGACELKLFDPAGSLTTKKDFEEYLGTEVYVKFLQAFREQS